MIYSRDVLKKIMKFCFRQICICRKKIFATKGKKRRLKRVSTRRKSIFSPNPTPNYIPLDLQIDTLLRLPVKSLLRFQCVSKLWSSIITSQDFRNWQLNFAASSPPSRLLITLSHRKELLLVSLPYPNASSSSSSSCCVPYKDLSLLELHGKNVYNAARGLICVGSTLKVGICNPGTRRLHVLPRIKFKNGPPPDVELVEPPCNYFLGYDPVGDQYKVLAVDTLYWRLEHKVVVLGGERAWRESPCVACPHVSRTRALYMDGTLYYGALRTDMNSSIIVSFDVRLETFSIINIPLLYGNMWHSSYHKTLINYEGKMAVVENPFKGRFRMWVVEDAEKEEWSMKTFDMPESPDCLEYFKVIGSFYTGEICLFPKKFSDPVCLVYYNLKTNSTRNVMIEGLDQELYGPITEYNVTASVHFDSFMLLET